MSKTQKSDEQHEDDDIYEDDFEKFLNEEIEEIIDDDEEFLKKLGFIADNEQKTPSDVSWLNKLTQNLHQTFHHFSIISLHPPPAAWQSNQLLLRVIALAIN